jgi:phosphoacetylglucosamine mutase
MVGGDILSTSSIVFIGMDTRDSSQRLLDAVSQGISLIGSQPVSFGEVTTPQLHWLTQKYNNVMETQYYNDVNEKDPLAYQKIRSTDFNEAWAQYFYEFSKLLGDAKKTRYQPTLLLDCANGVGAPQFKITYGKLQELFGGDLPLEVKIINDDAKPDLLNEGCGAEYVHKDQKFPLQFSAGVGEKCASFDGDADRLIYFYKAKDGDVTPTIIDGDK